MEEKEAIQISLLSEYQQITESLGAHIFLPLSL